MTRADPEARPAVVRDVAGVRDHVAAYRRAGERVGLVPTMGALHAGHTALIDRARAACDRVVVSLFVNPKQFDRADDLAAYPRDEARDAEVAAAHGVDLLFAPPPEAMYPAGFATTVSVSGVTETLEGPSRPGHFDGVATVVTKLLLQTRPDRAYFGEKDYQQLVVIRRLARDLDIPVAIEGVPIVREADGLALSSRNQLLTAEQRRIAPALARVLTETAETVAAPGADVPAALDAASRRVIAGGFDGVDYLALRDAADLSSLETVDRPARLLAAAWLGRVRLIDNVAVPPAGDAG